MDISDSWDSVQGIIDFYGNNNQSFSDVQGPGNFNDPDMVSCPLSGSRAKMNRKLILKSSRFVPFGGNLAQTEAISGISGMEGYGVTKSSYCTNS